MGATRILMMRKSAANTANISVEGTDTNNSTGNCNNRNNNIPKKTNAVVETTKNNSSTKQHRSIPHLFSRKSGNTASMSSSRTSSSSASSASTSSTSTSSVSAVSNIATTSTNNEDDALMRKTKRSMMHLSIMPDEDNSECIQINLDNDHDHDHADDDGTNGSNGTIRNFTKKQHNHADHHVVDDDDDDGNDKATENNRDIEGNSNVSMYSVGSTDYVVKHGGGTTATKKTSSGTIGKCQESSTEATAEANNNNYQEEEEEASAGGEKEGGKKSKFGSFLKGGKKEKDTSGNSNRNNSGNDGSGNDKSGKDDSGSGESGDQSNENDENNNGNNNDNNSNNPTTPTPLTNFGPARTLFAHQCTLPLHAGPESTAPTTHPSWTPVSGTEFKVRVGPNYPKNGKKENSGNSLYEVYSVRFYRSERRSVGGATRIMPLPVMDKKKKMGEGEKNEANGEVDGEDDANENMSFPELKGTKIPDVLVVHFMLPYEPPNMFKQKDDGPGGECIYYLRPSQRFLDEISGRIPITPATQLFAKWCSECQSNSKMRSRFKCMALVRDIEKHNLGLLKPYNGKPVLITESGRVCSGFHGDVSYLEMTANVHNWAFMAKKGFVSIIPKFKNMQLEVGFTIEGHTDCELPECMLGSTVLSYISDSTGPMITPDMQEPMHEHQS